MNEPSICEKCQKPIGIGNFPFCPHGPVGQGGIIDDTLPGGARWMHNLGDEKVWVETKTQYKKELASRGLVQAEWCNTYNKQDKSPYATRTRLRPGEHDPFLSRK